MTEIKPLKSDNNDVSDTMILLRKNASAIYDVIAGVHDKHAIGVEDVITLLTAAENIQSWASELAVMMLTGSERWCQEDV